MSSGASDTDVLIKIITAYEKGGIEEAKKAAAEVSEAFGQASSQSRTTSGALEVLSQKGAQGAAALRNLSTAAKGGPGALNALGSGISQVAAMLGAGGGFLIGIQLAVSGVQMFMDILGKQKKEAEAAAEAAKKHADDLQAAADQIKAIHDTSIAERAEEFRQMGQAAREAAAQASAVANAQLALENARIDNQIAGLEAQKATATPEQAEAIAAQISVLRNQKSLNANQAQQDAIERERQGLVSERDAALGEYEKEHRFNSTFGGDSALWLDMSREEKKAVHRQVDEEKAALLADSSFGNGLDENERERAAYQAVKQRHLAREEAAQANVDAVNARIRDWSETSGLRLETLQVQQDTLRTQGQTQQDAHERRIGDIQKEQDKKAADAAAAAVTPGDYWRSAAAQIGRGQDYKGQHYEIDNGATQQKARQALADAGKAMAEGKKGDDAQIMGDLVAALEEMGAVVKDRNQMLEDLRQAVALMRQQTKNQRS